MSSFLSILKKLWPARFRYQLILIIALVHLLLMSVFVFDLVTRQRDFLGKQNHEQTLNFVNNYASNATPNLLANNFDELERITLSHINFPNLKYAMILSPEGVVLAHTNTDYIGKAPTDAISLTLKKSTATTTLIENDVMLDIAAPIFVDNKLVGWARAGMGQEYIQQNLTAIFMDGVAYIFIALMVATLFAILIGNALSKGLYKLISAAERIKGGDRKVRVASFKTFELSELGTAFNQMLDDISNNETLLRMVIDNMPVGVWIFNEKREIISGNSAGIQIWEGSKQVGSNGSPVYKARHADSGQFIEPHEWASVRALSRGETTINEELDIETGNKKFKRILNSAIPLRGKEGTIIGAIAINVDITEKKKITEQLALSESTLSSAFEYSAIGMTLVSPDGKFLKVNKSLCRLVGYTEEELLSLTFQDITHPDDLEADLGLVKQALNGVIDSYRMEKRYFHREGNVIWVHLSVSLVKDKQGQPLFFISQIEDITERKKIIEQLALSESTLRSAFDHSAIGMALVSIDGNYLKVNKELCRMWGYTEQELLSRNFRELTYPEDLDANLVLFRETLAGERDSFKTEKRYLQKGGAVIWGRLSVSLLRDNKNQPLFFVSQVEDITESKKAERVIVQFNRLYQFSSAINDMMLHAESKQDILFQACDIAITQGKFLMAWIGNFSPSSCQMEFFTSAGQADGYLESIKATISAEHFERGVVARMSTTKKPYCINDIASDPVARPWKKEALQRGFRSVIFLPVIVGPRLEAVFTLYTPEAFFFNDEEIRLLLEVTNNIAYAIEKLELKALQKRSEEELKESEEKFRKLVEETPAGVFILQESRFVYVNPQFEKISGYSKAALLNELTFDQLVHKDELHRVWEHYFSRISGARPSDHYPLKTVTRDGTELQVEIVASLITYKGKPAIIGTVIDITAQVEEEHRINKAVTDAQESERQQISMELHDNVKQMMAASLLNIDFLRMIVKEDAATLPVISNVKNYMREAIEELRRISHQLAPSIDEKVSLEEKIRTVVDTMNVSGGLAVNYHFENLEETLKTDVQLALYRILQEQFTNILKYAGASTVDITVEKLDSEICMLIEDNGIGFNTEVHKNGLGLENIKRRVQVFNGNFKVHSAPGTGCRLHVQIPVHS